MSDWQGTLDIQDTWQKALDFEISYQELAGVIATKLRGLKEFGDDVYDEYNCATVDAIKEELIYEFENFDSDDVEDFDALIDQLYDWGDISLDADFRGKKVCWIKTTF